MENASPVCGNHPFTCFCLGVVNLDTHVNHQQNHAGTAGVFTGILSEWLTIKLYKLDPPVPKTQMIIVLKQLNYEQIFR